MIRSTPAARLRHLVWECPLDEMPPRRAGLVRVARTLWIVTGELAGGQLNLWAASLVYTTLLSIVPLLAVSFSVLKGFGVHNQIEPMLHNLMAPIGEVGIEMTGTIIGFVDNLQVGVLGSVGLGVLIYTVVSLVQKVERAFNYVWRVETDRPLSQRLSGYLSVLLVGPLLVFSAIGATASLMRTRFVQDLVAVESVGATVNLAESLVPYGFIIVAFTLAYVFLPNTRVRFGPALLGALVAGALWQSVGWAFASFIAGSGRYTAIYSGFAVMLLFMIWLYLAWLIALGGAAIAFYRQHPEYLLSAHRQLRVHPKARERIALGLLVEIAGGYYRGDTGWTLARLARELGLPEEPLREVLSVLEGAGLLLRTAGDEPAFVLGRAPETLQLRVALDAVAEDGHDLRVRVGEAAEQTRLQHLYERLARARDEALGETTLADLVAPAVTPVPEPT